MISIFKFNLNTKYSLNTWKSIYHCIIFCIRTKDRILEEVLKYNFYSNGCAYKFADNSLFLFNLDNKFRKFIIRIITNRIFDLIILLFIFANSIFLGLSV